MATKKAVWTPLDLTKLPDCRYLACDPSYTALGLVLMEVKDGEVVLQGAEKLVAESVAGKVGWEDTFARADIMEGLIDEVLDAWVHDYSDTSLVGVHESPPTGGGSFVRSEVATLSGKAFRDVCREYKIPIDQLVTPQSHKKLISGNHLAKKTEHHAALKLLMPQIFNSEIIKNEATRDALSIALYSAHRKGIIDGN